VQAASRLASAARAVGRRGKAKRLIAMGFRNRFVT
jgi:hypothetical protein